MSQSKQKHNVQSHFWWPGDEPNTRTVKQLISLIVLLVRLFFKCMLIAVLTYILSHFQFVCATFAGRRRLIAVER